MRSLVSAKPGILLKLRFPKGKSENHFVPPLNKNNIKKICLLQTTNVSGFQNTSGRLILRREVTLRLESSRLHAKRKIEEWLQSNYFKMLVSQISTAINGRVNEPKHQINKVYLCNSNSHRPTHQSFSVVHRKALEFFKISSSVRLGQNTDRFIYSIDYKPRKITPG